MMMHHPLVNNLSNMKDSELESRMQDLSKKYFQSINPGVRDQVVTLLNIYRTELDERRAKVWQDQYKKRDTDLDSLINVS